MAECSMQEDSSGASNYLEDVTERFRAAAQALPTGSLVSAPESAVVDMMNAIEVGTNRIDSGLMTMDIEPRDLNCDNAKDVCDVMDQMCNVEMAWLAGSTLVQTVFTSVYYHKPDLAYRCTALEPLPSILRAYGLAFAKSVDLAYYELHKGHVRDVEDCWMESFGVAVKLDDRVEDVLQELDRVRGIYQGLEGRWWDELDRRLVVRGEFLKLLDRQPYVNIAVLTRMGPTSFTTKGVAVVAPRLRQTMPLPRAPDLTPEQSNELFISIVNGFANLDALQHGAANMWRVAIWRDAKQPMPAVVRSAYKSAMLAASQTYGGRLADEGLYTLFHQSFDSISAMRILVPPYKHEDFDMWLHSLKSDAIETLCLPLQNPARQKRAYDKLSFDWAQRAAFIEQFRPEACTRLAVRLYAIRLDCILESAILALELDLTSKGEAAEHYWWIYSVCSARLALPMGREDSWWQHWLTAWALIAAGMVQATVTQSLAPSFHRFAQRHKWALKRPSSLGALFQPSFEAWCRGGERLVQKDGGREFADRSFDKALVQLDRFAAPVERSSLTTQFHHAMSDLRSKVLEGFGTTTNADK